jgi:hypothetical protein
MRIHRERIIQLFDEKSKDANHHDGSDVTAVISFLGEDLLLGALQHYWKSKEGAESRILDYKCTPGRQKGPRLDGWLLKSRGKDELYQVEVKNWAVYAIGGKELHLTASTRDVQKYAGENWDWLFGPKTIQSKNVAKVLEPMKKPKGYEHLKAVPLVCFWFCIGNSSEGPYSKRSYSDGKVVHVFSASAYLRSLKSKWVDLKMQRAERRNRLLLELTKAA